MVLSASGLVLLTSMKLRHQLIQTIMSILDNSENNQVRITVLYYTVPHMVQVLHVKPDLSYSLHQSTFIHRA